MIAREQFSFHEREETFVRWQERVEAGQMVVITGYSKMTNERRMWIRFSSRWEMIFFYFRTRRSANCDEQENLSGENSSRCHSKLGTIVD